MNKQEAEAQINKNNNEKWFCPIINAMCRHDCYSFYPSYLYNIGQEKNPDYRVKGSECVNAMMVGVTQ